MRMIHLMLGVLLAVAASLSFASAPITQYGIPTNGYDLDTDGAYLSSKGSACGLVGGKAGGKYVPGSGVWKFTGGVYSSDGGCILTTHREDTGATDWYNVGGYVTRVACSDGSAPDTSKPLSSQCPDPPPPNPCQPPKSAAGTWTVGHSSSASASKPDGGSSGLPKTDGQCAISIDEVIDCYSVAASDGGRDFFCTYKYTQSGSESKGTFPSGGDITGGTRTPSTQPPVSDPTPEDGCPKGTVSMGVDSAGITMCGGSGTHPTSDPVPPTTTKTETSTNPDGSTTTKKTDTQTNSDGSTTTRTTTTTDNPDGTRTTNTTTVTSDARDGTGGKPDGNPDDSKYDICKLHPELTICMNSTIGGACAEVTCTGDAIQCAIAREQAKRNCEDAAASDAIKNSAQYGLGSAAMAGNDPAGSSLPSASNGTTVSIQSSLDSSGWAGAGSCFPDKTITFNGHSFVLPWSQACSVLVVLRYALMVAASLIAYRMLAGVIFQE